MKRLVLGIRSPDVESLMFLYSVANKSVTEDFAETIIDRPCIQVLDGVFATDKLIFCFCLTEELKEMAERYFTAIKRPYFTFDERKK